MGGSIFGDILGGIFGGGRGGGYGHGGGLGGIVSLGLAGLFGRIFDRQNDHGTGDPKHAQKSRNWTSLFSLLGSSLFRNRGTAALFSGLGSLGTYLFQHRKDPNQKEVGTDALLNGVIGAGASVLGSLSLGHGFGNSHYGGGRFGGSDPFFYGDPYRQLPRTPFTDVSPAFRNVFGNRILRTGTPEGLVYGSYGTDNFGLPFGWGF